MPEMTIDPKWGEEIDKLKKVIEQLTDVLAKSGTSIKVLIVTIVLIVISSLIGSFLYGLLGFILSVILGVIATSLAFRARKRIADNIRAIRESK